MMFAEYLSRLHRYCWFFSLTMSAVLIATVLTYLPGLHGPFVFDDRTNLFDHPQLHLTSLTVESLVRAATGESSGPSGRPIAMMSFAINYYFSGFESYAFKVTNLAIHLACGILLLPLTYILLTRLQKTTERSLFTQTGLRWVSLAVASLWLLHPLNLTSVLYVVQRMNSLATLFILAGLLMYVIGREQALTGRRQGIYLCTLSIPLFTILAVFSKENGALLPVYAILIEWVFYRMATDRPLTKPFHRLWWALVAVPVILGTFVIALNPFRWLALHGYHYFDFTLGERLLSETRVLWFYLRIILLPDYRDMGLYHDDIAISRGLLDPWTTLPSMLGILVLLTASVVLRRRQPLLAFGILWFLAGHSLESTVVPLEIAHDHRNYLPLWGILLPTAWYLLRPYEGLTTSPALHRVIVALLCFLLGMITYARANTWKDQSTLVVHDVLNHPQSARARTSLGLSLHEGGQDQQAQEQLLMAASLNPTDSTTIIRLVHHHYLWKKAIPNEMLDEMERRLMRFPLHPVALWTYEPLIRATRPNRRLQDRLLTIYERTIARPDISLEAGWRAKAIYMLGLEAYHRHDYRKALNLLEQALKLNNRDPMFSLLAAEVHMKRNAPVSARDNLRHLDTLDTSLFPPDIQKRVETLRQWSKTH